MLRRRDQFPALTRKPSGVSASSRRSSGSVTQATREFAESSQLFAPSLQRLSEASSFRDCESPPEKLSKCRMWPICGSQIGNVGSEARWGPIMECQDATAHIADYLGGSLPVEEVEALLIHAAACAACRDKLMASDPAHDAEPLRRGARRLSGRALRPSAKHSPAFLDAPLAITPGSRVPGSAVADSLPVDQFERRHWRLRRMSAIETQTRRRHAGDNDQRGD